MKSSRGTSGTAVKREDGGYISSSDEDDDDDEEAGIARKNIDQIEISSDEEEDAQGPSNRTERSQRSHGASALLPVRILRKEHTQRAIGINTDASSEAAAKILQQAEALGTEVKIEIDDKATRKGKGKVKDVEITGVRKPYKGMWQDGDDEDVQIKEEAISDDEDMADAVAVGISEPAPKEPVKAPISSPEIEKKPKARGKSSGEPVMQTDEERSEYDRYLRNLGALRHELGQDTEEVDAAGDSTMQDAGIAKENVRDNNAYLFQFPPQMPRCRHPDIKKEPTESIQRAPAPLDNGGARTVKTEDTKEEDEKPKRRRMPVVPGMVGKIRVHQSGRTTLRWGGATFDLNPGIPARFMQEVLEVETIPPSQRVVPNEGGDGTSYGRVKGKFVVTPNWEAML
jgi:DNA-directed RNA polymerase III subunit RPC4